MKSSFGTRQPVRVPVAALSIAVLLSMVLAAVIAVLTNPSSERLDEVIARLEGIEQSLTVLEELEQDRQEAARRRAEEVERVRAQRREQQRQAATAAANMLLDSTVPDEAKVRAWQNIRMGAADVWTDEIVAEAVRIGTTSPNPQIRADIWRQAHANHTNSLLLQPLLQALADDPDRSVREEAAETLDLYRDQPGVREALRVASASDEDPGVRTQAADISRWSSRRFLSILERLDVAESGIC